MRVPLRPVARFVGRRLSYANVVATVALFLALGTGTAYAANTVFSTDIVDGEVKGVDIAQNTVGTSDVVGADLKTGSVSLTGVANGRCTQVTLSVAGTKLKEFPMITPLAPIQNGIVLRGQRVSSIGHVVMDVCNFSGTSMATISNLPVRVITYG